MSGHGHGHSHASCAPDGHGHSHGGDDDDDNPERGQQFSLFKHIDTTKINCMNGIGNAAKLFRAWHERLDTSITVDSDADEQLLLHIPFTGEVTLKSVIVIGGGGDQHPRTLKLFVNRPELDFSSAGDATPTQQIDLAHDRTGALEYPTRIAKFQGVRHLTMFFSDNFGDDVTRLHFIGLRGDFMTVHRTPIITAYELKPNPADHPKTGALADNVFRPQH
ncbi:hypothetical protein CAOG_06062 [Capsaspora owczarzaki ATCC 30864]|uniref:PITH domain-containing protein n=1 Tax=Capsaspora owczarzaki (strain ATCC 30864) TaxID=595528 RepID=A0A0D2WUJ6_CAPO3|nr:hypothetical protein CAOG_06062 [Capsaspora owczarzaki ATCC 30864]KJE95628.1 hypothetical protein CAOG_006062 [Capsaspora owczarzaki ATCC 30864]|eukprot:XP_004345652.1 hypothetical protein CAOG_06062 [Capsaspora owczarzaki ATCC 30864]